jgi:hypothetical protein
MYVINTSLANIIKSLFLILLEEAGQHDDFVSEELDSLSRRPHSSGKNDSSQCIDCTCLACLNSLLSGTQQTPEG